MTEELTVTVIPRRRLFMNEKTFFSIYSCDVAFEDMDKVKIDKLYGNISCQGNYPDLEIGRECKVVLEYANDEKYPNSYKIVRLDWKLPDKVREQRAFLSTLLTSLQVENIYRAYSEDADIINMFLTDTFDFSKVKGIGIATCKNIRDKVVKHIRFHEIIVFLSKYDIPYTTIKMLINKHQDESHLLIKKLKKNPYILTELDGVGFKKADLIAQQLGLEKNNPHRIDSCIWYVINEESKNGHSWIPYKQLINITVEYLDISKNDIDERLQSGEVHNVVCIDDKYANKHIYEAENYVSDSIIALQLSNKKIFEDNELDILLDEYQSENKIELTKEQLSFFHNWNENAVSLLIGNGGCVDKDTEFFNGQQWKKISEYTEEDLVLQYQSDGTTKLVKPLKYHKLECENLNLIKNESGSVNQCLSDEHNIVYETSKGHIAIKSFEEVKERHEMSKYGFSSKFRTVFNYSGEGINLTDDEIRLMIAVIADSNFVNLNDNKCRINVKKDRKKIRLVQLLEKCRLTYTRKDREDGFSVFVFYPPRREKYYTSDWYNCTQGQLRVVVDEVLHWDGTFGIGGRRNFSTVVKESADFIQFAFSATGSRATISMQNRIREDRKKYKNIEYTVIISKHPKVSIMTKPTNKKTEFKNYKTIDGYKYCFTLDSGMWVMRRNNRIVITGNCGKSWLMNILIKLIKEKLGEDCVLNLLSPTGRASKVLGNFTKTNASTIHRYLGKLDEDIEMIIKLDEDDIDSNEIYIIDESSMCDIPLMKQLFSRIKNGSKVLFVGDDFQLPSVGVGNFLYDLIHSNVIKVSKLTKVFRQKDGGILEVATNVREGNVFLNPYATGRVKIGQDCVFKLTKDKEQLFVDLITSYVNSVKMYGVENVAVLSPQKGGMFGVNAINQKIQELINPKSSMKKEKSFGKDNVTIFRVGDKVMNIANQYDVELDNGNSVDVFNGDEGFIVDVDDDNKQIIVEIDGNAIPISYEDVFQKITHSWANTIHKYQGSQIKVVIVIVDASMKYQLNANLLYTGFSRAEKLMLVLGQADTINYAMGKFMNMERRSFLQDLLRKYQEEVVIKLKEYVEECREKE